MTETDTTEVDVLSKAHRPVGGAHTQTPKGKLEIANRNASTIAAEVEAMEYDKAKEAERLKAKEAEQAEVNRQVEKLVNPASTKKQKELARKQLDRLKTTLPGRMLYKKALEARGIDLSTAAEMVEISTAVGRRGSDEKVGEKTALEARKHATSEIGKVYDVDRKQEESTPQIIIVVGVPFKEASDAADTRNTGHPVGTPRWSNPSPEESE